MQFTVNGRPLSEDEALTGFKARLDVLETLVELAHREELTRVDVGVHDMVAKAVGRIDSAVHALRDDFEELYDYIVSRANEREAATTGVED